MMSLGYPAVFVGANVLALAPDYATPLNTLLLLVTLIVVKISERKRGVQTEDVKAKIDEVHSSVHHAASAAASAADAAATSARITREIGDAIRTVDVSPIMPPKETT